MKNKLNLNTNIQIINKNIIQNKNNTKNINNVHVTHNNIKKNKIKYSLPKNIIIGILNDYCKLKKKNFIKMAHLIKKRKKNNNVVKIFNKEKNKQSHKRSLNKHKIIK
jgi:hypothetical protein